MAITSNFHELPRDASSEDNETSSMRSKGRLAKLRLNDGEEQDLALSAHTRAVLKRNNLRLQSEVKTGLFEGLSDALFLDKTQSQRLKSVVCKYLVSHHKRNLPESLKFLDGLSCFASHYSSHQDSHFFEPVTLQAVSELFEKAVIVYTIIEKNQVLLSSIYNNCFSTKCHLLAYPVGGMYSFNAVFPSYENPHRNSHLSTDDQLREVPFVRKLTTSDCFDKDTAEANLALLESKLKELDGEAFEKGTLTAADTAADTTGPLDPNGYAKYISAHLSPVSLLEMGLQKLKENENNVSSVNKQLNSVLQIYTHSVTKSEFLQGNKFHFLDEINISNVDPARKAQIIFGDRTEHLIRSVPPGILKSSTGRFQYDPNSSTLDANLLTPNVRLPSNTLSVSGETSQQGGFKLIPVGCPSPSPISTKHNQSFNLSLAVPPQVAIVKEVPGDTTVVGDTTTSSKKHKEAVKVIEYNKQVRHSGRIKFYHEKNKYGFITPDNPADRKGDIFVYEDALIKETKLTLKELSEVKKNGGRSIHVTYCLYRYLGNDGEEREKAVDLEIIKNTPAPAQGQS